ncbi:MAG: flagellin [Phycisphaeraceae bacterium]
MSRISSNLVRTTTLQGADLLLSTTRRTQISLQEIQKQISTGLAVSKPSDAPEKIGAILLLQSRLESHQQEERNAAHGSGVLGNADVGLGDISNLLLEAKTIAASQIGIASNAQTRQGQGVVIDELIKSLVDITNRQFQGVSLFGGNSSLGQGEAVFEFLLGGVQYKGATNNIKGDFGLKSPLDFNVNGADALGALSTRVESQADLNPNLTNATRLSDLNGAQGLGIRKGTIDITVNGTAVQVDLSTADNAGDVQTRINNAIIGLDPAAGSLAISGGSFELTANAGHTITIGDTFNGQTAGDLGIDITATSATTLGSDTDPRITERTTLASFGLPIDFASGLLITNGSASQVVNFTGSNTVQDMMNRVASANIGVRLSINADGTALNLVNEISGLTLSIGENGGSTATDLGLRSFNTDTNLSDLRFGLGVESQAGADDFAFQLHSGATFNVNLDGPPQAKTLGDVMNLISAAAAGAGLTVGTPGTGGTDFNVGLAATGNGFVFEDGTAGASDFAVSQLGISLAATHLGIYKNAGAAGAIQSDDVAKIQTDSVFTHLIALRDALLTNDEAGITIAGDGIERSIDSVARARADVGVKTQRLEQQTERLAELKLAEKSTLSLLQDADLTAVITRLAQLQQQLQASFQSGLGSLQTSLLDFLR